MKKVVLSGALMLSAVVVCLNVGISKTGEAQVSMQFGKLMVGSLRAAGMYAKEKARAAGMYTKKKARAGVEDEAKMNVQDESKTNVQESLQLGVPFISQGNTMVCEATSLLEALTYLGITNQSLSEFVNSMPRAYDDNPYHGFSGEWRFNVEGTYQGMMLDPLEAWARGLGCSTARVTHVDEIRDAIRRGEPVIVWVVYKFEQPEYRDFAWGRAVWNGHVVCIEGFNGNLFHVVDPALGKYDVSGEALQNSLNVTRMGLAVGR